MSNDAGHIVEAFRMRVETRIKDLLQRLSFRFAVYVERFMDEHGPEPGTRSGSQRIGLQEGHISRALIPRQSGNITRIVYESGAWTLETGIDDKLVPYANIHEYGGVIVPKSAKALVVPVSPEAAAALKGAGGNVRSLNLVVIPKKDGTGAYLAKVDGEKVTPWFALRKSVKISARPYYNPGTLAFYQDEIPKANEELLAGIAQDWHTL